MKKVIKGKSCNTKTAMLMGWLNDYTLYRRRQDNVYFVETPDEKLDYCSSTSAEGMINDKRFVWNDNETGFVNTVSFGNGEDLLFLD